MTFFGTFGFFLSEVFQGGDTSLPAFVLLLRRHTELQQRLSFYAYFLPYLFGGYHIKTVDDIFRGFFFLQISKLTALLK